MKRSMAELEAARTRHQRDGEELAKLIPLLRDKWLTIKVSTMDELRREHPGARCLDQATRPRR